MAAKWKKTGYEKLCCTYAINTKNFKFGTVSICRVPKQVLNPGTVVEDTNCGCRGCSSGEQGERNIFGNKYGQYLAAIQVRRERRQAKAAAAAAATAAEGEEEQGAGTGVWGEGGEDEEDLEDEEESEDVDGGGGAGGKRLAETDADDAAGEVHKKSKA